MNQTDGAPLSLPADRPIHLVGIGGAGMSALASILLQRGHAVSGSDLRGGKAASALSAMGAVVHVGHAAEHIADAALVVVSTAVPQDNPEVVAARQTGVPVVRRAELLAALMRDRTAVLVAGTHGKTTTTSMLTVALQAAGVDASFAIGGMIHESGTSAHHGADDVFVAEADESDRSFLVFTSDCAIVTNVEVDHHDVYADFDDVLDTFAQFLANRTADGIAVLCADDDGARQLAQRAGDRVITYGEGADADVRMVDVALTADGSSCRLVRDGTELSRLQLRVPGRHNLLNATAAMVTADWLGADPAAAAAGLASFTGAQRRFQRLGTRRGVTVVDDYAHHPTEITATLAAARQTAPAGRLVAVFQPHRYSRTAALAAQLGAALGAADVAVVTDVYAAGEAPVPGVTGQLVAEAAGAAGAQTHFVAAISDIPRAVADLVRDGDLVLTLGAGDITQAGALLLDALDPGGTG
jgi:UDP-N-acetylmuramate--alanine ligase